MPNYTSLITPNITGICHNTHIPFEDWRMEPNWPVHTTLISYKARNIACVNPWPSRHTLGSYIKLSWLKHYLAFPRKDIEYKKRKKHKLVWEQLIQRLAKQRLQSLVKRVRIRRWYHDVQSTMSFIKNGTIYSSFLHLTKHVWTLLLMETQQYRASNNWNM